MGKYFGTDGIRGKANEKLTVEMAYKVGRYLGYYYASKHPHAKIVVGKDTRLSSDMLEHAIASGASASGADVYLMGFCPTPSVAYIVANEIFVAGVMISASHNPYYDNGIKIFNHDGQKIEVSIEHAIEEYLDDEVVIPYAHNEAIGRIYNYEAANDHYLDYLAQHFKLDLSGYKIAIDCANGSAFTTAEKMLKRLNASCTVIANEPNGININKSCGSTHPEHLQKLVAEGNYDLGLAFDGDADRLIAVNHLGELVDGDHILYICAKYLSEKKLLNHNTVVTTVMANLGLFKAYDSLGIAYDKTSVGDKYVFESMLKNDYILGGEQSGHIIFKQHATTGDGLLTALVLLELMNTKKASIKELSAGLSIYPQLLINLKVSDKERVLQDVEVQSLVEEISKKLADNGRILVRSSGTESLVRVMVEAESSSLCEEYVYQVIHLIEKKYN